MNLHARKLRHSNDGVDEDDKKEEATDIEQSGKRDYQRKEKFSKTFRGFHQTQNPADAEKPKDAQQSRVDERRQKVRCYYTWKMKEI